jgi:hypothetical protein
MRMATGWPVCSRRTFKRTQTVAKANEPSAPDQQQLQF